jgi:hypothetical protein
MPDAHDALLSRAWVRPGVAEMFVSQRISNPLVCTKNEPMTLTALVLSHLSSPVLLEPLALPRKPFCILTMQDVIGRRAKPNRRPYAARASVEDDGTNALSATTMPSFSIPPLGLGNRPMHQTPLPLWCALVNSSSVPALRSHTSSLWHAPLLFLRSSAVPPML